MDLIVDVNQLMWIKLKEGGNEKSMIKYFKRIIVNCWEFILREMINK